MEEFFSIISNFGFPVAVASYLLFRFEKKLESLEKTNNSLVSEIHLLEKKVSELNKTTKAFKVAQKTK